MQEPHISPDFTVDDIHKVREHNYEMTKNFTKEERIQYYKKRDDTAMVAQRRIDELRKLRLAAQHNLGGTAQS